MMIMMIMMMMIVVVDIIISSTSSSSIINIIKLLMLPFIKIYISRHACMNSVTHIYQIVTNIEKYNDIYYN